MYTYLTLDAPGATGAPVPNTFLEQRVVSDQLAVVFPGVGYTVQMPLLYYATRILAAQGADVALAEYSYSRREDFQNLPADEQMRRFLADATAVYAAAKSRRAYTGLTLIGKSLGTLAMGHLLASDPGLKGARAVWITPLLRHEELRRQIAAWAGRSLFACGSADDLHDAALLSEAQSATGGQVIEIAGADHSLEIDGDISATLDALGCVMKGVADFLR